MTFIERIYQTVESRVTIPARLRLLPDMPQLDTNVAKGETKLLVPSHRQLDPYSCGATSAFSILKTFKPDACFEGFYEDFQVSRDGTTGMQLACALRKNGVGVSIRHGIGFNGISRTIEAGYPIIAGINLGNRDCGHWVIVYGYRLRPRLIFVCNQTNIMALSGRESFSWPEWRRSWDGSALVCWGEK